MEIIDTNHTIRLIGGAFNIIFSETKLENEPYLLLTIEIKKGNEEVDFIFLNRKEIGELLSGLNYIEKMVLIDELNSLDDKLPR